LKEALSEANWLPLSAVQVNDAALQQSFIKRNSHTETIEQQWDLDVTKHYARATQLAQEILGGQR
jgi:hypothetical protein